MKKNDFQDEIDVTKYQRDRIAQLLEETKAQQDMLDDVETLLQNANCYMEDMKCVTYTDEEKKQYVEDTQDYQKLLEKIHINGYHNIDLFNVATIEEVSEANRELAMYYHEYTKQYDLDVYDYAITGIIGTMSALMDLLLVTEINGGVVSAGKLKSGVESLFGELLSADTISELEKKYKVSYDISKKHKYDVPRGNGIMPVVPSFYVAWT